ncbi:hypothetical protein [Zooshikella ganghwensis]|uniref:hypothetical protein n=1 Tax=Zooshikella ganghwensis TaxID=202772 RepID=UPI0004829AE8|nr:hypothetical protein [Zooshikella ganghwensis]
MEYLEINTTKYSTVIRAAMDAHPKAEVLINNVAATGSIEEWCTNKRLKEYINFSINVGGSELWSYHDHPANLLVVASELPLVEKLASSNLLRFKEAAFSEQKTLLQRIKKWFA